MTILRFRAFACVAFAVSASPVTFCSPDEAQLTSRQDGGPSTAVYSVPEGITHAIRAAEVGTKRDTFRLGPSLGVGPAYPARVLGAVYVNADDVVTFGERDAQFAVAVGDSTHAMANAAQYNGLKNLDDYTKLYDGVWRNSSRSAGQDPGLLANYTQDLLFSMARLSTNPYAIRRLKPVESLPFLVESSTILGVAGRPLENLLKGGRLFSANHRNQSAYNRTQLHGAACDAYFYMCRTSGDFLQLAIRTKRGQIMFNVNDFFTGQPDHLARNHSVAEGLYEAAIRALSDDHSFLATLKRLMYGAFGIRPLAVLLLLRGGGAVSYTFFPHGGTAASQFTNDTYANGYAGAFHAN
ncbi:hypothetical protein DOTSEDRAFT_50946 [Dothistroma septosporum NZE10]|uniref:Heme haloperoxidase family profile domain-containing protein n=1 Tax=Dothistroma septosporum (strain NZE10 / CBS 128990) TaxID=675120 RepID=N1PVR6_DOTSN|nr:hypothetical protein DOTSEDRAFT_50946 [Dothistroma septosporum NZE10]